MNQHIERLLESAPYTTISTEGRLFTQQDMAVFAELIVAECMQIIKVDMYEDAISNMWSKNKLQMIKEHFGVEE